MWPFNRRREVETRQAADGYSDAILLSLLAQADGDNIDRSPTAVAETCASLWSRSFAMATVTPETPGSMALNPAVMADMGRALYEVGEYVALIEVVRGRVRLRQASSHVAFGDRYQVSIAEPDRIVTKWVRNDTIVHCQYHPDRQAPWRSYGPLTGGNTTAKALSRLESRLADELLSPVGTVLPVPSVIDGDDDEEGDDNTDAAAVRKLQAQLRQLRGQLTLVESAQVWADEQGAKTYDDGYNSKRIGANPPAQLETIRQGLANHIAASGGVPSALLQGERADGTSMREAFRQFLFAGLLPVSRIISVELAEKLDSPGLKFDFTDLQAADLQGRSRAMKAMTDAGKSAEEAAEIAGLEGA